MSLLLVSFTSIAGIILGKILFKKWFNHLMLYCIIFGGMTFFYELKLLPYVNITPFAWFIIGSAFLSFVMGILTLISARNLYQENPTIIKPSVISLKIFSDNGRTLQIAVLLLSLISLYASMEIWMILIRQFGSIPAVLINGQVTYRLNIEGKIKGNTPYIYLLGYVAVFFAGIYTAYKKKFTFLSFLPLISIVLRELAFAGRAGMLIALMEFAFSFLLFRYLLNSDLSKRFRFSKKNALIAFSLLIAFFIVSASIVRLSRTTEIPQIYRGATKELRDTKEDFLISPSVYLYISSDVGVLSKYLSSIRDNTGFGQNTFLPFYLFLSKINVIERPKEFQRGYFIPMWSNTGTFLRELHADFGITGVFLGPYLIGLLITWLWIKFYENKSLIVFAFLVYSYLIIGFSFLMMITRLYHWAVSLAVVIILIPVLEQIAVLNGNREKLFYIKKTLIK